LLEPVLDLNVKSRWAFKVIKLANWIGVGIAFRKVLEGKSFKFD